MIPDPEMTATQLGPQHRFAILASDGIWEFISSQRAVDTVGQGGSRAWARFGVGRAASQSTCSLTTAGAGCVARLSSDSS